MKPRYLLDTNITIHIRRRNPAVMRKFMSVDRSSLAISPITFGELYYGVEKSPRRDHARIVFRSLVESVQTPILDRTVAEAYGRIRADLASRGVLIGVNDLWIAAHALAGDYTLVTDNEREFARVPGLRIENWVRQAS